MNMHYVVCVCKFVVSTVRLSVGEWTQADHVSAAQGLVQCQIPLCVTKDTSWRTQQLVCWLLRTHTHLAPESVRLSGFLSLSPTQAVYYGLHNFKRNVKLNQIRKTNVTKPQLGQESYRKTKRDSQALLCLSFMSLR